MKTYKVNLFRVNPQLKNGGYEVTREFEARGEKSLLKKVQDYINKTCYGTYKLISYYEMEER